MNPLEFAQVMPTISIKAAGISTKKIIICHARSLMVIERSSKTAKTVPMPPKKEKKCASLSPDIKFHA
jgi:hypothetical protein